MLSTYGKHPNYARCGDRFVVCAYTYRAWTPEEWRAPFGGSARRRKRTTAPSALSRRETWCASGSFAAARDDERIRAGKIQNVLDYIWKNLKDRLGKDAMRENAAGTVPCKKTDAEEPHSDPGECCGDSPCKKTGAEEPHSDPACGRHGISDTM